MHDTTTSKPKKWLYLSLLTNLGILGFFKYCDFFIENAQIALASIGLNTSLETLGIILPVGISFYTFQTLAYSIDVYRKQIEPEKSLLNFALYVAYFPQLVAGPIERASTLIPQFKRYKSIKSIDWESATLLFLTGLCMKFCLGDFLANDVDRIFSSYDKWHSGTLLSGAILFAFQIFGDFAGYSLMARGVSLLFGVHLRVNFREPYFATSITDFWHRWHISLSNWLRDYVYIFWLGGNRKGKYRTKFNLMATMLLGGLWHGASWNFVIWGALHGAALSVHKSMKTTIFPKWFRVSAGWCVTMFVVAITWIFFRMQSVEDAYHYTIHIFDINYVWRIMPIVLFALLFALLANLLCYRLDKWTSGESPKPSVLSTSLLASSLLIIAILFTPSDALPFVYFQF